MNEDVRPRFECYKWENIKAHCQRARDYRALHIVVLGGKATEEQKRRAQELEKKLDVFNLTYIRRSAEIEAKKKKEQEPKSWWGGVSSWWGGAARAREIRVRLSFIIPSFIQRSIGRNESAVHGWVVDDGRIPST